MSTIIKLHLGSFLLAAFFLLMPVVAHAAGEAEGEAAAGEQSCTNQPGYENETPGEGGNRGIVTIVAGHINDVLAGAHRSLMEAISNNSDVKMSIYAAVTLFIIFYAVFILFGLVQLSLGDAVIRLIKIAIVFAMLTPAGWDLFNDTVVKFFNDGTDQIINMMTGIALGYGDEFNEDASPLIVLDRIVAKGLSAKFAVLLIGTLTTGVYGIGVAILLGFAIWAVVSTIITSLRVYIFSLLAKTLLFGLAPIFLSFMLFSRTKHLFDGWLNQLIGYSLQPILLFAFLGFYFTLMESALTSIMRIDLCFVNVDSGVSGTDQSIFELPRFLMNGIFSGEWSLLGAMSGGEHIEGSPIFPLDIVNVLIFLLLSQIAKSFAQQVPSIARELSNATVYLNDIPGAMGGMYESVGQKLGSSFDNWAYGRDLGGGLRGDIGGMVGKRPGVN